MQRGACVPPGSTGHHVTVLLGASTKGRLLLAAPPLVDPNFARSVVLMLEHTESGALGLVLNRPSAEEAVPGLEAWEHLVAPPSVVFGGGPVDTDALIGLARAEHPTGPDGFAALPEAPMPQGLGTVDLELPPDEVAETFTGLRIFRGYAGWGAGQLDAELEMGGWIVLAAEPGDVFTDSPDDLWRAVLRRQPGRLGWLANCPDDLSWN
jgi:putative transcriptional regulator